MHLRYAWFSEVSSLVNAIFERSYELTDPILKYCLWNKKFIHLTIIRQSLEKKIQFKDILLREINYIQHQAFIIIFSMYNSENYLRIRTKPDDYNNRTIHPRSIFPFSARSSSPWERNVEIKVRGADVAALREGAASPPAAAAAADTRCDHMSRRGRTVCARRFRKSHGHRVIRRLNASWTPLDEEERVSQRGKLEGARLLFFFFWEFERMWSRINSLYE